MNLVAEFARRGPWITQFVIDGVATGGDYQVTNDRRVQQFLEHFPNVRTIVSSSNPDFQTKVERVGNGKFQIDVAPKETTYPMVTTLTIQPENLAKTFYANARRQAGLQTS